MRLSLLLAVAAAACAHAQTAQRGRLPVSDVRVLMVSAIDSPDGMAHGILTSKDAEAITRHFKTSGPILIDVSTERRYAQPGCRRLKVSFSQDDVHLPGEKEPKRQTIDFGINYCRDGLPPRSPS